MLLALCSPRSPFRGCIEKGLARRNNSLCKPQHEIAKPARLLCGPVGTSNAYGRSTKQYPASLALSELQLSFAAISGIRNLVTKRVLRVKLLERSFVVVFALLAAFAVSDAAQSRPTDNEIGRASCWARGEISVVA